MLVEFLVRRALLSLSLATLCLWLANPMHAQSASGRFVGDMVLGSENAPITVIEYASFTCPHCARFHRDIFPVLKANFIDAGLVRLVYREVYFGGPGLWAAMVARCASDSGTYFAIVDRLYAAQAEWTQGAPAQIARNLKTIGSQVGLSDHQRDGCLSDGDFARALWEESQANAKTDGIRATPSFIVNGERLGNFSYADFEALLNDLLGR